MLLAKRIIKQSVELVYYGERVNNEGILCIFGITTRMAYKTQLGRDRQS